MKKLEQGPSIMFGQNVIRVHGDSKLTLTKPDEHYTNLTLWANVPRPINFSNSHGFGWSGELSKDEGTASLFAHDNSQVLRGLTQLISLSLDGVSLLGCVKVDDARALGQAFAAMPRLNSLKLNRVLSVAKRVRLKNDAVVEELNRAFQNFAEMALTSCVNLEELECHYNYISSWSAQTWINFGSGLKAVKKLKRISFKDMSCVTESSSQLCALLKNQPFLESCEIKLLNSENMDWAPLLDYLKNKNNLQALEIGAFDFSNNDHIKVVSAIWNQSKNLRSLGLKLNNFNSQSTFHLVKVLSDREHENFSQLILDVDNLNDINVGHVKSLLDQTNLYDIRIIKDEVDVTPAGIAKLCVTKLNTKIESLESIMYEIEPSEAVVKIEDLLSRLGIDNVSVPVLGHQFEAMFQFYYHLSDLEKSERADLRGAIFSDNFLKLVLAGKIFGDYLVSKDQWISDKSDVNTRELLLKLLVVFYVNCSEEELASIMQKRFSEVIKYKLIDFYDRFHQSNRLEFNEALSLYQEVSAFYDFINDGKYRAFINNVELKTKSLELSYYKEILSGYLGDRIHFFEACVRSHLNEMAGTDDHQLFSQWFSLVYLLIERIGSDDKMLRLILSTVKKADLLATAGLAIEALRKPGISDWNHAESLRKSLPILLMAKRGGYVDQAGKYDTMLKDYKYHSGRKKEGEVEQDIENAVKTLFRNPEKEEKTKEKTEVVAVQLMLKVPVPSAPVISHEETKGLVESSKVVDKQESKQKKYVDLKKYLKPNSGDAKPGDLERYLRPKSEFFDKQVREKGGEAAKDKGKEAANDGVVNK